MITLSLTACDAERSLAPEAQETVPRRSSQPLPPSRSRPCHRTGPSWPSPVWSMASTTGTFFSATWPPARPPQSPTAPPRTCTRAGPDGSRIAFSSGRSGNVTQIYTMTPTGGTVTRIGYSGKPETMPAWSH